MWPGGSDTVSGVLFRGVSADAPFSGSEEMKQVLERERKTNRRKRRGGKKRQQMLLEVPHHTTLTRLSHPSFHPTFHTLLNHHTESVMSQRGTDISPTATPPQPGVPSTRSQRLAAALFLELLLEKCGSSHEASSGATG